VGIVVVHRIAVAALRGIGGVAIGLPAGPHRRGPTPRHRRGYGIEFRRRWRYRLHAWVLHRAAGVK
jgi:hypothetical protein